MKEYPNTRDCEHGRQRGKCADCEVIELEKEVERLTVLNKNMHTCVSGYLSGKEWEHWQKFNEPKFILK